MDHYAALGLGHDATADSIRTAYRRLAKSYHPDVSTLPDAHQRFIRITEAYEVLSDPVKRARYDMTRHSPSPRRATPREEPRYERDVRRYQQQAKERAERFSRMSYSDFDQQYFDTAVGYFAPKMLGCFGIIIAFFICLALVLGAVEAFDLPLGIIGISMLVLIPLGVWASTEFDARHNRWMRERKTRR
ncbi:MAG: DnaJ domain-containing protein [Flavobacteriales bacterium]|nr:DnaJ domain-containing protein [Flavobacteriales bacterium]